MAVAKRIYQNLGPKLVFLYLALFPLGQLLKVQVDLAVIKFSLNSIDLLVLLTLFIYPFGFIKKPPFIKSIEDFVLACLFSLVFSLLIFAPYEVLPGTFYFIRFISYISFFVVTWNLVVQRLINKDVLFKSLIAVAFFTAVFGWIQYMWIPDLTFLKFWGWDDHLFRLTGTFLDPTFTGIIVVLGTLCTLGRYVEKRDKKYLAVVVFLIVSLAFTYSRSSFLALILGSFAAFFVMKKKFAVYVFLTISVLAISIIFLPRLRSEGTLLERTQSIYAKVGNYKETIEIFKRFPLFGVGFNNICAAKVKYFRGSIYSHACYGADSSILYVLATTGVVGFIIFASMVGNIFNNLSKNLYGDSFWACAVALLIHSTFAHSLFYPWVMGYMGILLALSLKN